jgi:hypothetical protein
LPSPFIEEVCTVYLDTLLYYKGPFFSLEHKRLKRRLIGGKSLQILLYMVFTISGAAGLIYESIWSHYLSFFVGHSAYAQIMVLAIFLGGMSLGALAVGQYSERLKEPLLWYAGIELAVGVMGFLFHQVFQGGDIPGLHLRFPPTRGYFCVDSCEVGHGRGPSCAPVHLTWGDVPLHECGSAAAL